MLLALGLVAHKEGLINIRSPNTTFTPDGHWEWGKRAGQQCIRTFFNTEREISDSNFLLFLKHGTGLLVFVLLAQTVDNDNRLLQRDGVGIKALLLLSRETAQLLLPSSMAL